MSLARDWLAEFRRLSAPIDADAKIAKIAKKPEGRGRGGEKLTSSGKDLQGKNNPAAVHSGMTENLNGRSASPEHVAGVPFSWIDGVTRLGSLERQNGYSARRWSQLLIDASAFIEIWAVQAAALGWNALDIFGVHPQAPDVRQDCKGLVPSINGAAIVAITADAAWLRAAGGTMQVYYCRPRFRAIPVWELPAVAE